MYTKQSYCVEDYFVVWFVSNYDTALWALGIAETRADAPASYVLRTQLTTKSLLKIRGDCLREPLRQPLMGWEGYQLTESGDDVQTLLLLEAVKINKQPQGPRLVKKRDDALMPCRTPAYHC